MEIEKNFFFSVYKHLEGLIFYRIEGQKVIVKLAIPKYKSYVSQILKQ